MFSYCLNQAEQSRVLEVAIKRQDAAIKKGRPSAHGYDESNPIAVHLCGTATEYVTHVYTGLPWHALLEVLTRNGKKPPDVGDDIQVRGTTHHNGHLIVHDSDDSDERFVLGTLHGTTVRLIGWTSGHAAKQPQYWGDRANKGRPAYWVPQSALRPIEALSSWKREGQPIYEPRRHA